MSTAPQDLERTDEQPKSQYVSRRDVRVTIVALVVLAILLSPIYFVLKERRDAYLCKRNFQSMAKAISLYAAENNDRLPPVFVTMDGVTPLVEKDGGLYTWAFLIDPFMKSNTDFKCPKASEDECYFDHKSDTGKLMPVSYGMYLPHGGLPISNIPNPEEAILITETSALGSKDTFDPHPILDSLGKPVPDSFAVTWDTGNVYSTGKVAAVSRLAYPNTSSGKFVKDGASRHPDGNHFLTASGTAFTLPANAAKVTWDARQQRIVGRWAVPDDYTLNRTP